MNAAPIQLAGDPGFERFIPRHCRRYRLIARPKYARGVFKFKSPGQAQAAR